MKEIAKFSGAGYSTVKIFVKNLEKDKWLVPTRKISKIILYKLNVQNPEVKKFLEFYWEVIENEINPKAKEKANDFRSYSNPNVAVSIRHS